MELSPPLMTPTARSAAHDGMFFLLVFIFSTEFLPSEAFLNDYFVEKGFSHKNIIDDIFPLYSYSRLPAALVMGLLSQSIGASRTLVVGAIFGCFTVAMTRFCNSLLTLQITQMTVALSGAAHDTAFWAALQDAHVTRRRSSVECEHTDHTEIGDPSLQLHVYYLKAALAVSNLLAGLTGTFLRQLGAAYERLWEVSLFAQGVSLLVALRLAWELAAYHKSQIRFRSWTCDVLKLLRSPGIAVWTLWDITSHVGHLTVATFWQSLLHAKTHRSHNSNGAVAALGYLGGAMVLFATARLTSFGNPRYRWWLVSSTLSANGLLIMSMGAAVSEWEFYSAYIAFQIIFRFGVACRVQQMMLEAQTLWRDAAGESAQPPLALLFCLIDLIGAAVQAAAQYALTRSYRDDGKHLSLASRFEILGAATWGAAFLMLLCKARCRAPQRF